MSRGVLPVVAGNNRMRQYHRKADAYGKLDRREKINMTDAVLRYIHGSVNTTAKRRCTFCPRDLKLVVVVVLADKLRWILPSER